MKKNVVSDLSENPIHPSENTETPEVPENSNLEMPSDDEIISHTDEEKQKGVQLTSEQLNELLHQAYLRGRNENIQAQMPCDCRTQPVRNLAGELIIKGLSGVAKAIFRPGRRSVWHK